LMRVGEGRIVCKRGAEGYQIVGLLAGVLNPDAPGVGIAFKVTDGDPARESLDLTHSNRVRPAVTLEILRQLRVLSSEQQRVLSAFGPEKPIKNHQGIITGQSHPVLKLADIH
ncbi:MAG TPA: asparaginase, partial [Anaerolineales bacterium]|nr:asparaginase [Anaerolineales bacterium]